MNEKVLLIHTDGYDIDVSEYISIDNARKTMIEAYDDILISVCLNPFL